MTKKVPFGINSREDYEVCKELNVIVYVFNRQDINGESRYSGYLTDMDEEFIYVAGTPFGRNAFIALTEDH